MTSCSAWASSLRPSRPRIVAQEVAELGLGGVERDGLVDVPEGLVELPSTEVEPAAADPGPGVAWVEHRGAVELEGGGAFLSHLGQNLGQPETHSALFEWRSR